MNDDKDVEFVDLLKYSEMQLENAALREAGQFKRNAIIYDDPKFDGEWIAIPRVDFDAFKAALSSAPTDKVLVDVEKLRDIEWVNDPEYDSTYCQICGAWKDIGHLDDCWLGILTAKES